MKSPAKPNSLIRPHKLLAMGKSPKVCAPVKRQGI